MTLGSFQICKKFAEIFASQVHPRYQRPVANFATSFAGVVDTGGKFATGVNDAGDKLPPVSTTLAANLPPVSTTPVANNGNNIRLLTT
jgi:hypothetical protein